MTCSLFFLLEFELIFTRVMRAAGEEGVFLLRRLSKST